MALSGETKNLPWCNCSLQPEGVHCHQWPSCSLPTFSQRLSLFHRHQRRRPVWKRAKNDYHTRMLSSANTTMAAWSGRRRRHHDRTTAENRQQLLQPPDIRPRRHNRRMSHRRITWLPTLAILLWIDVLDLRRRVRTVPLFLGAVQAWSPLAHHYFSSRTAFMSIAENHNVDCGAYRTRTSTWLWSARYPLEGEDAASNNKDPPGDLGPPALNGSNTTFDSRSHASSASSKSPTLAPNTDASSTQEAMDALAQRQEEQGALMEQMAQRMQNLEQLVAKQNVDIRRLQNECDDLTEAVGAFARVVDLLQKAGLASARKPEDADDNDHDVAEQKRVEASYENWQDSIFGSAPSSVLEAADAAGAAILAAILGGQQRMLVDVRDAELQKPETLVQFLELAILPVAAGLEGLRSPRNRLKIVFPTVSQLLTYRKTMALAAPEVVALSTLGLEPIEQQDNLVVLVVPPPDDEEGWDSLLALLQKGISQPVVMVNHHMAPVPEWITREKIEVAYHLRLLSVQYTSTPAAAASMVGPNSTMTAVGNSTLPTHALVNDDDQAGTNETSKAELFEEAVAHATGSRAREPKLEQTRAMVIRAYPEPWHVFVDVSPDTDADFSIAATFDFEPTSKQVHSAIVECLEGSQREDELVAQQMQEALESGQLDRVSEMWSKFDEAFDDMDEDDEDVDDDLWNFFGSGSDTV